MNLLVDANIAVKWVIDEEYSPAARALYEDSVVRHVAIVAPNLLRAEFINALYQMQRRSIISSIEADEAVDRFLAFPIRFVAPPDLPRRALELARRYELSAAYDAHYLALSRWLDVDFWTADQKLVRSLPQAVSWVRWIGDYA